MLNRRTAITFAVMPVLAGAVHASVCYSQVRAQRAQERSEVRKHALRHPYVHWGASIRAAGIIHGADFRDPGFSMYTVFPEPADNGSGSPVRDRRNTAILSASAAAESGVISRLYSLSNPQRRMRILKSVVLAPQQRDPYHPHLTAGQMWMTAGTMSYQIKDQPGEERQVNWQTEQYWNDSTRRWVLSRVWISHNSPWLP